MCVDIAKQNLKGYRQESAAEGVFHIHTHNHTPQVLYIRKWAEGGDGGHEKSLKSEIQIRNVNLFKAKKRFPKRLQPNMIGDMKSGAKRMIEK